MSDFQLLKPREVAERLAVSERTLYTLTKEGVIPCVRLSERTLRYRLADVEAAIEQRMSGSTSSPAVE